LPLTLRQSPSNRGSHTDTDTDTNMARQTSHGEDTQATHTQHKQYTKQKNVT